MSVERIAYVVMVSAVDIEGVYIDVVDIFLSEKDAKKAAEKLSKQNEWNDEVAYFVNKTKFYI